MNKPDISIGHAKKLSSHEDGSLEWLDARRQGIGGSDAATVLGMKPYGSTRVELWRRKTGRAQPFDGNVATEYGTKLEPYIFKHLAFERSDVEECTHSLQHPEHAWMRANVDGLEPRSIVEIKTSSQAPPAHGAKDIHYAQIQHYLAVTGLDQAIYVYFEIPFDRQCALEISNKFVATEDDYYWEWIVQKGNLTVREIPANEDYQRQLIDAEREFWQCVQDDEAPGEYIPEGEIEVEDTELAELLDIYGKAKAQIKDEKSRLDIQSAKDQKEFAKEQIKKLASAYDAKRIHIKNGKPGDHVLWNGRGYWQAKPADRVIEDNDSMNVPF